MKLMQSHNDSSEHQWIYPQIAEVQEWLFCTLESTNKQTNNLTMLYNNCNKKLVIGYKYVFLEVKS